MIAGAPRARRLRAAKLSLSLATRGTLAAVAAFLLVPTFVLSDYPLPGLVINPMTLWQLGLLVVLGALTVWCRPTLLPTWALAAALAFVAMVALLLASVPLTDHWLGVPGARVDSFIAVPWGYLVVPLVQATLAILAALLAVAIVPPADLFGAMWLLAVAAIPVALVGWAWNVLMGAQSLRFATFSGGAAVVHTALIFGVAVLVAAARRDHHRLISSLGATAYVAMILLAQARAGLVVLGVFTLLLAIPLVRRVLKGGGLAGTLALGIATVGGAALAAVAAWIVATRGLQGAGRVETWRLAWQVATDSPERILVGFGSGTLWPWYGIESGRLTQVGFHGLKSVPEGLTLAHAHSVYVGIGGELGVVGLTLLAVILAAIGWAFLHARGTLTRALAAALIATTVGFGFDTYLLKNFAIAFVWWAALFATIVLVNAEQRRPGRRANRPLALGSAPARHAVGSLRGQG